jgi:hypothetical protein
MKQFTWIIIIIYMKSQFFGFLVSEHTYERYVFFFIKSKVTTGFVYLQQIVFEVIIRSANNNKY